MGFNKFAIRELRRERGCTIESFANLVGVSKQVMSTWETGACEPRVNSLAKISATFKVPIDYFFLPDAETIVSIDP